MITYYVSIFLFKKLPALLDFIKEVEGGYSFFKVYSVQTPGRALSCRRGRDGGLSDEEAHCVPEPRMPGRCCLGEGEIRTLQTRRTLCSPKEASPLLCWRGSCVGLSEEAQFSQAFLDLPLWVELEERSIWSGVLIPICVYDGNLPSSSPQPPASSRPYPSQLVCCLIYVRPFHISASAFIRILFLASLSLSLSLSP